MQSTDLSLREMLATIGVLGLLVGLGKLLASDEKFSWRLAIGRSIISGGLAIAAGAILSCFSVLTLTPLPKVWS